eukprot:jgi/Hompol1/4797/HPOL_001846-RA
MTVSLSHSFSTENKSSILPACAVYGKDIDRSVAASRICSQRRPIPPVAELGRIIDSNNKAHIYYDAFLHYLRNSPADLSALSPRHFTKVITAIALNYGGITMAMTSTARCVLITDIFTTMLEHGIVPEPKTCELVLRAISRGPNDSSMQHVQMILSEMQRLGYNTEIPSILDSLVALHLSLRQDTQAFEILNRLIAIDSSAHPFNVVIEACLRRDDVSSAMRVVEKMRRIGPALDANTYKLFTNFCVARGDLDAAEAWIQQFRASGLRFTTQLCAIYMKLMNSKGNYTGVLDIVEEMKRQRIIHSAEVRTQHLVAVAGLGLDKEAWALFADSLSYMSPPEDVRLALARLEGPITPQSISKIQERIAEFSLSEFDVFSWLTSGYVQLGDYESCKTIVTRVETIYRRPLHIARYSVARAFVKAKRPDLALDYIEHQVKPLGYTVPRGIYWMILVAATEAQDAASLNTVLACIRRERPDMDISQFELTDNIVQS